MMPGPKFCVEDESHGLAIGAARSRDHCRQCYRDKILSKAELKHFKITSGTLVDARTGQTHGPGDTVELDPMETNIPVLVAAGLGHVVDTRRDSKPTRGRAEN